jgi:hypothetical protein
MRFLSRDHVLIVQVAQAITGSLGALYLYRLAYALTDRRQLAAIAALLYAFDPLLIRQAAQPADAALMTTLLVAFTYYFIAGVDTVRIVFAGMVLGLVVLTRSMTLPLVPFALAVLMADRRFYAAIALTIAVLVLVLPFVVRNRSVNGSLWPTRSGLNLYIGNSPYTAALLPEYDLDILQEDAAALIEAEVSHLSSGSPEHNRVTDALLTRHAVEYMREHPLRTLRQKVLNTLYFFSPRLVPFYIAAPETRAITQSGQVIVENPQRRPLIEVVSYSAFYTPVLIAALVGIYLRWRDLSKEAILWCVVANFITIHALYFPATRYRAPMEFVLLFYAAAALQHWLCSTRVDCRDQAPPVNVSRWTFLAAERTSCAASLAPSRRSGSESGSSVTAAP